MSAIKLAIVGLGRAGLGMHTGETSTRTEKFQVVAGCDVLPERCAKLAERYACQTYADVAALVRDPQVEVVSIATPSTLHVEHTIQALEAGKIVFLEKPIAITVADAERMIAVSMRTGVPLYFRHNRRFEPGFQHIREILASGILGKVFEIKLRRNGFQFRTDWQTLIGSGGGQLNNWGPHIIDHGLRLLESPLKELWSDLKLVAARGDAEDHLKIIMKGENGRLVDLEISGGSAIGEPEYLIAGDRGALKVDGGKIHLRYLAADSPVETALSSPATPALDGGFGGTVKPVWVTEAIDIAPALKVDMGSIWDYLYDTIRHGKPFPITTAEALQVVAVTEQVRNSSDLYRR